MYINYVNYDSEFEGCIFEGNIFFKYEYWLVLIFELFCSGKVNKV